MKMLRDKDDLKNRVEQLKSESNNLKNSKQDMIN